MVLARTAVGTSMSNSRRCRVVVSKVADVEALHLTKFDRTDALTGAQEHLLLPMAFLTRSRNADLAPGGALATLHPLRPPPQEGASAPSSDAGEGTFVTFIDSSCLPCMMPFLVDQKMSGLRLGCAPPLSPLPESRAK